MTAYHDSTNAMNFLLDCLNKGTVSENGESTIERRKQSLKAKLLGIINVEVCEDEDALQQLSKYQFLLQKYTTSTLSAAIPKGSAPANKKKMRSRKFLFYQTKDTEEKYQVGKTN